MDRPSAPFFPPKTIDTTKPVVQRCGRPAEIIDTKGIEPFPIRYRFQAKSGEWVEASCRWDGFYSIFIGLDNDWDLVQATEGNPHE